VVGNRPYNFASLFPRSVLVVAAGILSVLMCALCFSREASAQTVVQTAETAAPPPLKYIPDEARDKLAEARDDKSRTRASLELADGRLIQAAQLAAGEQHDAAAAQLGIYQALIADAIRHLRQSSKPVSRNRDLFKRIELALRAHVPRIESIRRITPSDDAVNVKAVIEYVRGARTEALNAFYGDTVMSEGTGQKEAQSSGENAPNPPPTP